MQTFLPDKHYYIVASMLDDKRLGKQRIEAWQILQAIDNPSYGWQFHPAVNMWRPYREALICYGAAICAEWLSRGFKDTMFDRFFNLYTFQEVKEPAWLRHPKISKKLIDSHRSALLAKNPEWYSQFGWDVEPMDLSEKPLPYFWPEKETNYKYKNI
ncbi:MAG: MSMEG_6728 family protein [Gammaproteobacteria bacterium]|nr:MSMEG_6728 family protein [Gammaproteobacteria bacterium]